MGGQIEVEQNEIWLFKGSWNYNHVITISIDGIHMWQFVLCKIEAVQWRVSVEK